ncbi:MAG: hypothetical protein SFX73_09640 [Kofleriaceae bacterium]|nr:hypothetical protein [Kofleriaceae bacterium]
MGSIVVVLVTVVLGLLADRKWGLLPDPKRLKEAGTSRRLPPPHAPGEAPASALDLSPGDRERLIARMKCTACKVTMSLSGEDAIRYDQRDLRVLRFACSGCGATRSVYVA